MSICGNLFFGFFGGFSFSRLFAVPKTSCP